MKLKYIFLLSLLLNTHIQLKSQELKLDSIEPFIHKLMEDFEVTGLALGIVQGDSVLYSKGFGTRKINETLPIDSNTIFGIGSISKSFTALTLGILVDQGKLHWDDKVIDYLTYFELYDPYVSQSFTIRDLLTHRSGLKEISGGTLWYHSDLSRKQIIKRLKYLKPQDGFREKASYQNIMYMVAGEVVRSVSGQSWDEFLQENVFHKLEMYNSTSISEIRESNSNLAYPHVWNEHFDKVSVVQEKGDNLAAAGFIYSSSNNMINYMKMLLNNGVYRDTTIISKEALSEIFKPQILYPIQGSPFGNEFTSYGFGWWVTPKNDYKLIEHNGGIDGMAAKLFMIPEKNIGVIILTNISKEPASYLLKAKLLEQILEDKSLDFYDNVKKYRDQKVSSKNYHSYQITKINNTQPSYNLSSYSGAYFDEMYGDINIEMNSSRELEISFTHSSIFKGVLEHWHYDTYKINWYDVRMPKGFLTFSSDEKGEIEGIQLDQPSLLDVDFSELTIKKKK